MVTCVGFTVGVEVPLSLLLLYVLLFVVVH